MRRTKIVATIGPATSTAESMRELLDAGVDVVRLNAAHASVDVHAERAAMVRATAADLNRVVAVLVDLPGPKIRSGPLQNDEVELTTGATFTLVSAPVDGDATHVSTTIPELARWVGPGDDVFLADGAIVLRVSHVEG